MSSRAALETKKRPATNWLPARDLKPAQRSDLPRREESSALSAYDFPNFSNSLISGHDFSRIAVQAQSHALESQRESCPLVSAAGPRACPFGGACHACPIRIQTKLAVNEPGDEYEQEADRLAEQVVRMADTEALLPALVSRKGECIRHKGPIFGGEEEHIPRAIGHPSGMTHYSKGLYKPAVVQNILSSSGRPLDNPTRLSMESRFGSKFRHVRVHADERAAQSASRLNALAFTINSNIVFASGQYSPNTERGQSLLAHELTHVLQQSCAQNSLKSPLASTEKPLICRKEEASLTPADKERVWGFWITRSMCGCVPQVNLEIEHARDAIGTYRSCDLPEYTTGTEVQDCFCNKVFHGPCIYWGETSPSGCVEEPEPPADPCGRVIHRSGKIHETFHRRQADRIARSLGSEFWNEWKKLEGNCDRLDILEEKYPEMVEEYYEIWNEPRGWVRDEVESYTREIQFLHDVKHALKRICV